ncbi:MAG: hypothetical protein ACXIUL_03810 [Wenzhouxiangella sp.]
MRTTLFTMLGLALVLAACGSQSEPIEGAASAGAQAPAPATEPAGDELILMTADDGWVELHSLDIPEAGTARLVAGDETIVLELECHGPGIIDHSGEVPSIMASRLFNAQFSAEGSLANGWRVQISGHRRIVDEDEARRDLRFYRYRGMDRVSLDAIVFDDEDMANASFQGGPNDQNRHGEGLPLLHVQPDGSFTAVTEMISAATMIPGDHRFHRNALAGPIELAGRCPQPWAELPMPGGMRAMF